MKNYNNKIKCKVEDESCKKTKKPSIIGLEEYNIK